MSTPRKQRSQWRPILAFFASFFINATNILIYDGENGEIWVQNEKNLRVLRSLCAGIGNALCIYPGN